ncbi:hypothetical protein D3C86_1783140 [compost metagenome]
MFVSKGPYPRARGSIFFLIPSRPAINIAAKARYGLAVLSGVRNSIRQPLGVTAAIGIRTAAERLPLENTRFTGAS